ncbi:MAG TPA: polyphosphate kinase 1 [Gemmatimonadaceae bacterium]|nr:polyphosphate kinase 1 [Gemmatimonadaceae bacterium]
MPDRFAFPALFINRELSWLEFNARVLREALDDRNPLLERLKFLSIFATNLDEFYMVRVAGLRRQVVANVNAPTTDGLTPSEQLDAIAARVGPLLETQQRCLRELLEALAKHGLRLVAMDELTPTEWAEIDSFFETQVFPVLTPLAVDPGHPFPYISNLSLSLAVQLRDPERGSAHFARVKVPKSLPRWVPVGRPLHYVPLEQVIGVNLGALFPGMEVAGWYAFRITRNSDIDVMDSEEPEDLLQEIEEQVFRRRFGEVVRLQVDERMPDDIRALLIEELRDERVTMLPLLPGRDVHASGHLMELGDLLELAELDLPDLRDPPCVPVVPSAFRGTDAELFAAIRERDILVHHPFESFGATTEHFLEAAARDEQVLAIKLTLYRTSGDTAIVDALIEAAQSGKQVAVLVELKARFDEANNISWARRLESAGVHVAYGVMSLKTHSKTVLVVRREGNAIRRYVHIGTGNYNTRTARIYTDLGLFSADPSLGADVSDLFNSLTGFSRQQIYRKLLVAPQALRNRFLGLVVREAEHARAGRPARIVAKMNALVDPAMIRALYAASDAGVSVDLIVRGICALRPGIAGVSEHIRVISIVGRFLEHSRLWYFANGGSDEFYLGSADWMQRNFDRRVEVVTPIEDPALHPRLHSLLATYLADNRQSWELRPDGTYVQCTPNGAAPRGSHAALLLDPWGADGATRQVHTGEMQVMFAPG